ncbi:tripartite tricarboxylate transporter substrate binding protein [Aquabacterium sp. A7-Y]|uniref:Bug family tripartite tricarboxylate transporter substrate binding protein n=1 Tax=Aquabacterium sp. A7-Y TaxID=1349605 RepID=UPI00223D4B55|nr:tripartite tricarboxylate transporter substrate binding protein [Aquabacterium sp. A7-Y]MCW7541628.1 tripartite tricarboxylate transporter substrate binding protein [Aquabacterium sp. A7-Y]
MSDSTLRQRRALLCSLAAAPLLPATARAAEPPWPAKPIRLVLPAAGGSGPDILARVFAERLAAALKQPVLVDNRPGANGILAVSAAVKSPGDGYTVLFASSSFTVVNQAVQTKLPFDVLTDLVPVAQIASGGIHLVVHPQLPVRNIKELVALVKSRPGDFDYATWGIGSTGHLVMELIKQHTGIQMRHIPYKTVSQIYQDIQGDRIQIAFVDATSSLGQIKGGKVRAIASTGSQRMPEPPGLPTVAEQGIPFDADAWYGVFVPKGTPAPIVETLHAEINRTLTAPELRERFAQLNLARLPIKTAAEFGQTVAADLKVWQGIARRFDIRIES